MRTNSLKYHVNWHGKQQAHIFKKRYKEALSSPALVEKENDPKKVKDANEFRWLQKIVDDFNGYANSADTTFASNQKIDNPIKSPKEPTILTASSNNIIPAKINSKRKVTQPQIKSKRILVEIVPEQQLKRKGNSAAKPRSTSGTLVQKQKIAQKIEINPKISEPSLLQLNKISSQASKLMDSISHHRARITSKHEDNRDGEKQIFLKIQMEGSSLRKQSIGRIKKNHSVQNCKIRKDQPKKRQNSKIRLQTEYLTECLRKKEQYQPLFKNDIIYTEEYQKHCFPEKIIKQQKVKKEQSIIKHKVIEPQKPIILQKKVNHQQTEVKRFKQQRRLNKSVQSIKIQKTNTEVKTLKTQETEGIKQKETQKRNYNYLITLNQENDASQNNQFLLNDRYPKVKTPQFSQSSNFLRSRCSFGKPSHPTVRPIPQQSQFDECSPKPSFQNLPIHRQSQSILSSSPIRASTLNPSIKLRSNSPVAALTRSPISDRSDCEDEIGQIFSLLDERGLGILRKDNCQVDNLSEELKLIFSPIINQIKTKNQRYNYQQFIKESLEVIKIKNQVYQKNQLLHPKKYQSKNIIKNIIRENMTIFSLNQQKKGLSSMSKEVMSKRSSVNSNHSIVMARYCFDAQGKLNQRDRFENRDRFQRSTDREQSGDNSLNGTLRFESQHLLASCPQKSILSESRPYSSLPKQTHLQNFMVPSAFQSTKLSQFHAEDGNRLAGLSKRIETYLQSRKEIINNTIGEWCQK